jgi:excisionase family DNA binding protein
MPIAIGPLNVSTQFLRIFRTNRLQNWTRFYIDSWSSPLWRETETSVQSRATVERWQKMKEVTEVLTADEAADLLRVSTKTILTLAREGALPGEKVGRAWRFLRSDLLEYVRGSKHNRSDVGA